MSPSFDPRALVLEGAHARIEPLAREHAAGLFAAGADATIWRYLPRPPFASLVDVLATIDAALAAASSGGEVPFAIVARADGTVAGSTRFLDIRREDRALEIGWTWLGTPWQRGALNTECKYLLLRHAFEGLGAVRVQLKTDRRNERSQRAIERLGAVREGTLRRQRLTWDGVWRDTVYYSVVDSEWPAVRERLEGLLARR